MYDSLVGKCEYRTQPKDSFWCHVIDTRGAVLSLIFMNKFGLVFYFSFSFRYLLELRLLQNRVSRSMSYGILSCNEFCSCHLQHCLSIDLFSYWTPDRGQKSLSVLLSGRFLEISFLVFSGTQHGIRGSYDVAHDRARLFEDNIFAPKMGPSLGFFECIGKFSH